ncbi:hypothetical protein D3C81_1300470 [compost metagenome]
MGSIGRSWLRAGQGRAADVHALHGEADAGAGLQRLAVAQDHGLQAVRAAFDLAEAETGLGARGRQGLAVQQQLQQVALAQARLQADVPLISRRL